MKTLAKQSPSVATMANAAAGVLACGCAVSGHPGLAALILLAAVLFDSLDGALARSFGATSDFGGHLDSLADAISFGVAPAVLVGSLLPGSIRLVGWVTVTAYVLCAVWRLARYNSRHIQSTEAHGLFAGLPTTGAGAAVATAVLVYVRLPQQAALQLALLPPCLLAALGILMVSRLPYRHVGAVVARLSLAYALLTAGLFVAASLIWPYEYLLAALTWGYVISSPLATATHKILALRHA